MSYARRHALIFTALLGLGSSPLAGCQKAGNTLEPNVYSAHSLNTPQQVKRIEILSLTPARVEVDNSRNRQNIQIASGVLGAVLGGVIGSNQGETTIGTAAGGAAGAGAASMMHDKKLVDGVSITYSYEGTTLNAIHVGRMCGYTPGPATALITGPSTIRIQPNTTCP